MYYVYFILNELNYLYYGSTNDLRNRLMQHNSGKCISTKGHQWKLIYYEAYLSESDAREREQRLKYHGQALAQVKRRIRRSFLLAKS